MVNIYGRKEKDEDFKWFREQYKNNKIEYFSEENKKKLQPWIHCYIIVRNKEIIDVFYGENEYDAGTYAEIKYPNNDFVICTDAQLEIEWLMLKYTMSDLSNDESINGIKRNFFYNVDFYNKKISFEYDGNFNRIQGSVPVYLDDFGQRMQTVVDTGATHSSIDASFINPEAIEGYNDVNMGGISNELGYLHIDITIAGVKFKNIRINVVNNLIKNQNVDFVIGMNILNKGKMILDCTKDNKYFELSFDKKEYDVND